MLAQYVFFLLAVVAVTAGLGMLLAKNPITSALWLILNLFCIAGLYLTLSAQFIAVIQVLVYAGAIMVLFLFVIMLLNLAALPRVRDLDWRKGAAFVLAMGVLAELTYVVAAGLGAGTGTVELSEAAANASAVEIAKQLFTVYAMPLEVIGILLLAATIGAVMLAKRRFA